ncbi:hypothetical protein ACS6OZ_23935 [Enterobacter hormaechei subsp. steigerwaltii]|uniref:hypothetical protein n=1 Tax=Enterobacter hormaechei TaxID=158836 RepID=UPI002A6479AB|nr:hypothetical protein [Enterobacter hormaechei]
MLEVMQMLVRLKRVVITLAILLSAVVMCAFAILVFSVGSAIAFSGSTGSTHQGFLDSLAPVFFFISGAIAFGGLVALVNAAMTKQGLWVKSIAASSVLGGLFTAFNPAVAKAIFSLLTPVFSLLGKVFLNN